MEIEIMTKCCRCDKIRPCFWALDPYLCELDPDEAEEAGKSWWCDMCFSDRHDEV